MHFIDSVLWIANNKLEVKSAAVKVFKLLNLKYVNDLMSNLLISSNCGTLHLSGVNQTNVINLMTASSSERK